MKDAGGFQEEESSQEERQYWLTPVKSDDERTADESIKDLIGAANIYAFGNKTPGRRHLKTGDYICFYSAGKGVVAHAQVASRPKRKTYPHSLEQSQWVFQVTDVHLYLEDPIIIDAALRSRLDAFKNRDQGKSWAWFVHATRKITENDFNVLTRRI
ncbi:hypothetical protein C5S53_14145 [Methanophagales archaeon]|nr:hypothetical protein C5S53_14145 [Methanophagales archaeon]